MNIVEKLIEHLGGPEFLWTLAIVVVGIVLGLTVVFMLSRLAGRTLRRRLGDQIGMVVEKLIWYTGVVIAVVTALQQLGVPLAGLLGAAGVAGIALGFASQTSVSNIISGLFLISEHPFKVGDIIIVNGTWGVVLSIDMLSVKIRTFDNKLLRVPNETMLKTELTNVTRWPIRRHEVTLGVAYKEDIARVVEILREIARDNPLVLDEPEPLIQFTGFGDSALQIFFGVWFSQPDFLALRGSILTEIKERFDAEGIEIPFPHRTLYTGAASDPFPIRIVDNSAGDAAD